MASLPLGQVHVCQFGWKPTCLTCHPILEFMKFPNPPQFISSVNLSKMFHWPHTCCHMQKIFLCKNRVVNLSLDLSKTVYISIYCTSKIMPIFSFGGFFVFLIGDVPQSAVNLKITNKYSTTFLMFKSMHHYYGHFSQDETVEGLYQDQDSRPWDPIPPSILTWT